MDSSVYVAKAEALISCAVTAQLICTFVLAYTKKRFSYGMAHFIHLVRQSTQILLGPDLQESQNRMDSHSWNAKSCVIVFVCLMLFIKYQQ